MAEYSIHAIGIQPITTKFDRMGEAILDASPAMEVVATRMMEIITKIFESQGRRGGGSWKQDDPEWTAYKAEIGADPRINIMWGSLMSSMTQRGDPNQALYVSTDEVALGSYLEYANAVNEVRPFTKFTYTDRTLLSQIIRDYLMTAFRTG